MPDGGDPEAAVKEEGAFGRRNNGAGEHWNRK
jgi:hypothetical protein